MRELKMKLRKRFRSKSAPPANGYRRTLIHEHYRVDPEERTVLPGLPKHDSDWPREIHDFFNLIILIPVVVLNCMNWNWDILLDHLTSNEHVAEAWTGEWFNAFFFLTTGYFVVDLAW
eukprot:CAMPEP_0172485418 /NCGR_PEP_ID=MMETSP1066-20121228/13480_1 /TAXON_ID=671091 /ORGANISM="Coscinodiscus wailesii, Strain CCMP2513" /LENGTH=117 /DNA_ID=CAMNT_0013250699 /DNA_START=83 /DNA_END=433 /DNA_ORIENTATION=+